MAFVIRLPRAGALAVEYVICADVHKLCICLFAGLCHVARALAVDTAAEVCVILSCVYCSICGTVDDCVCAGMFNDTAAGFRVGDVHFLDIYADALDAAFFQFIHQVSSKLAFCSCYQNLHAVSSFCFTVFQ